MDSEIGPVVLAALAAVFAGHGIRQLVSAYRLPALKDWGEKAMLGAASVCVAGVFAVMTLRILS